MTKIRPYVASQIPEVTQLKVPHRGFTDNRPIYLATVSQTNGGTPGNEQNWQYYNGKRVDIDGFMETLYPSFEAAYYQGWKRALIWGLAGCQEEYYANWSSVTSDTQMRRYWTSAMDDFDEFHETVTKKLGMPMGLYRGNDNAPIMHVGSGVYEWWNTNSANPDFTGDEWDDANNRQLMIDGFVELSRYFSFFGGDAVYYPSRYHTTNYLDFMERLTAHGIVYIHEGCIADEITPEADRVAVHSYNPEMGTVSTGSFAPPDIINGNDEVVKIMDTTRRNFLANKVPGGKQLIMFNGSGQNATAASRAQTLELLRWCRQYNVVPVGNFDLSIYEGQW